MGVRRVRGRARRLGGVAGGPQEDRWTWSATTPRAAWARQSVALAGTLCWLLLAFLAGVAVIYVQTALQATWGGPPLWPVFVGVACVTVVTVLGFTAGVFFPGRFTAPLAAIAVFLLFQIGFRQVLGITPSTGTYALLSPDAGVPQVDVGVYYHVAPDVSIVQVMFMGGIAVALFGVLGLAQGLRELRLGGGRAALRAVLARGDGWLVRAVAARADRRAAWRRPRSRSRWPGRRGRTR